MSDVQLITMNQNLSFFYWNYKIPCWVQGTVIDIETTGLEPINSELVGLGLVKENRISCFIRTLETSDETFRKWVTNKIERAPKPYIAYYHDFERKWLGESVYNKDFWLEIQPRRMHKKLYAVRLQHLAHDQDGSVVPDAWLRHDLKTVLWHLACDMFEELALYVSCSHEYRRKRDPMKGILDFNLEKFKDIEFLEKQLKASDVLREMSLEEYQIEWERKDSEIKSLYEKIDGLEKQLASKSHSC